MSEERSVALRALRNAVAVAVSTTRGLSDEQCGLRSESEGWPVVLVAYHIGLGLRRQAGWIARALTAEAPFEFDWEGTHEMNAVNAREHGALPKEDAAVEIGEGLDRLERVMSRMVEEDWGRDVFSYGGRPRSADVVLRRIVLPHVTEHLESLRRTLAESAANAR